MSQDIHRLSLTALADAIATGAVTSETATQISLDRLKRIGPALNCLAHLDESHAMEAARAADLHRQRGGAIGRLHGIPLAHKDLLYRAGRPCSSGSTIRRGFIPDKTATVLSRLDAAGAIDLGTLHMAEFALSPTGYNEHVGHGRNPWNTDHVPGGSSSGSGAAVAARLVSASIGSDTGGSIRHPAAMCGITGLKPTWSRVSRAHCMPLSRSLDCIGPLARTARDCARLLGIMSGHDAADPTAASTFVPDYEAALSGRIQGMTIGVPGSYYYDHVTPDVRRALEASLETFRDLGAHIVVTPVPNMELVNALMQLVMTVEAAAVHRKWMETRQQDYSAQVRSRISQGFHYPAVRYAEALALRAKIAAEFVATAMHGIDILHLPAISIPVPSIAETTTGDGDRMAQTIGLITHCTRGINYLGLPALAVPCGFAAGLPVGFQLVGRPFDEARLLCAGDAYQQATAWHEQMPPLAT